MLRILIVAIALAAGGGAAWLVQSALSDRSEIPAARVVESVPTAEILIAAERIERGHEVGPANLRWSEWPQSAMGEGMVRREEQPDAIETYTGWIARGPILPGEPVRQERLAEGTGGMMSLMLAPGMRAVALRISAESGAGGFILPDDRVDIVHTIMSEDGQPVSTTIIRNVRVLAVDQIAQEEAGQVARVAETVTLELTPEQVEALADARNSGQLSLALRSVEDFDEVVSSDAVELKPQISERSPASDGADGAADLEPQGDPHVTEDAPDSPVRGPVDVQIIRSGQVEIVRIEGDGE